jgi:hypothetical protein
MKLNPDCIRDILLHCEEYCVTGSYITYKKNESFSYNGNEYSYDEAYYHLRQCEMNEYFYKSSFGNVGHVTIVDLTPKAHEFLADIRSDAVWKKTKSISKEVGSNSLKSLMNIASSVVTEIVKKQLINITQSF